MNSDGITGRKPVSIGERLGRNALNEKIGGRVMRIVGGNGIVVREMGATVIVEATAQNVSKSLGTSRWVPYAGA